MGSILSALTKKTRNMKSVFVRPWQNKAVMGSHAETYKELCNLVERMKKSEWRRSDIDFEEDIRSLRNLKKQEKNILLMTAGFFLTVDSMVMDSLNNSLLKDLEGMSSKNELLTKAIEFYNEQNRQEQVHDEFYKDMGKALFPESYNTVLMNCHEEFIEFRRVFDFCREFQERERPIGERLLAYAFIECIVFFPFFAGIIFHRFKGNIRETVAGNHWVCNEEAMHVLGHSHIYKLVGGVTKSRAREMCEELVCLVKDMWSSRIFCSGKNDVNGFTLRMIHGYIDNLSGYMLWLTGFANNQPDTESQFRYMDYLTSYTRANFFEAKVIEYDTIRDSIYTEGFFNDCIELKRNA